jgi:transposase
MSTTQKWLPQETKNVNRKNSKREDQMAKVTREHFIQAQEKGWSVAEIARICGVTKQAVIQMRKKYFPQGLPPSEAATEK